MQITDKMVDAAMQEYNLALESDPRNTDQMRNSLRWPFILSAMRRDAMHAALEAALLEAALEASKD